MSALLSASEVVRSLACAWSAGTSLQKPAPALTKALDVAAILAREQRVVPLRLCCDLVAVTHGYRLPPDAVAESETERKYLGWLGLLTKPFTAADGRHDLLLAASAADGARVLAAMLGALWPAPDATAAKWLEQLDELRKRPKDLLDAWHQERVKDARLSTAMQPQPLPGPGGFEAALRLVWPLAAPRAKGSSPIPPPPGSFIDHVDFGAMTLYLRSRDAEPLADQLAHLGALIRTNSLAQARPMAQAVEQLHPVWGIPSYSALLGDTDEEVARDLMEKPRWIDPPPPRPPELVRVALRWRLGARSPCERVRLPRGWFADSPKEDPRLRVASVVQGMAALLADDWRCFLQMLPVEFVLQRDQPFPSAARGLPGGARWKDFRPGNTDDRLPPVDAARLLFRRYRFSPERRQPRDGREEGVPQWDCLLMAMCDLPSLGFETVIEPGKRTMPHWRRKSNSHTRNSMGLSKSELDGDVHLGCALVLDPADRPQDAVAGTPWTDADRGWLCSVACHGGFTHLQGMTPWRVARDATPFTQLRDQLLDVLLRRLRTLV